MPDLWQNLRKDFPITKRCAYLDHASGGPLPRPVHEKIQLYYQEHYKEADLAWPRWIRRREEIRGKVARFIHAEPSEIAFVHSTSQGMNLIADMLLSEGDVLTSSSEFPSSTLPWLWRKAKMHWLEAEGGVISPEKIKQQLKGNVKTILSSFVQYGTGFRQDFEALSKIKGRRYLIMNATQAFGALEIDVKKWDIDFLCTNSYKWLMAGYGGGVLYVKKKWLERFKPLFVSWRSMKDPDAMNNRKLDLKSDAGRYEPGCPSFPSIFAVGAAVEYLSEIGMDKIEKRILMLTDYAIQGLQKKGLDIVSPLEKKYRSGIVVFKVPEPEAVRRKLLARGIFVSCRGGGIRIAPHFYNTFHEIDRFLEGIPQA